jgi:hypothetical protein
VGEPVYLAFLAPYLIQVAQAPSPFPIWWLVFRTFQVVFLPRLSEVACHLFVLVLDSKILKLITLSPAVSIIKAADIV